MTTIRAKPGHMTAADLKRIAAGPCRLELMGDWRDRVEAAATVVADVAAGEDSVYGINTGFGLLARTHIEHDQLADLQRRLVLSHCAGTGPALDDGAVRLSLALKANALARGHSGVHPDVIDRLLALIEADALPVVPSQGSVGASGDLAPLAHLSAVLIGEGEVRLDGEVLAGADGVAKLGLEPLVLRPKEGLALLNGTQVSTALSLIGLFRADTVFRAALVAGAMSVDAAKGSTTPFDPRIQDLRAQPGQVEVAEVLRSLLDGSAIRDSHLDCDRVQDPYSLRCQPQVMGACLEQLWNAAAFLEREANAVTDNPLIFADTGEVLSGGNFHAEPVAFAADAIALAVAEIGNMSERRTALLVDPKMSGLPAFLVEDSGVNSGFMIAQVTAAALVAENRLLAHPASADTVPTSANQEDHVSMAAHGARRLLDMTGNLAGIVAVEMLAAAQGLDFHAPMKTSPKLAEAHALVRNEVAFFDEDRPLAPAIEAVRRLILEDAFAGLAETNLLT